MIARYSVSADDRWRHNAFPLRWRSEYAFFLIKLTFGKELKKQVRVRGAALAEVDFDGIGLPAASVILSDNEIDREAAVRPVLPADARPCAPLR